MKKFLLGAVLLAVVQLSGCAWATLPYSPGILYTSQDMPNQTTQNETGPKKGKTCVTNILGLISTGEAGVHQAAKKGDRTSRRPCASRSDRPWRGGAAR